MATKGWSAPEVEARIRTGAGAMRASGRDQAAFLSTAWTMGVLVIRRGELVALRSWGSNCSALARKRCGPGLALGGAHYMLGYALTAQGQFGAARAHAEQGIALYDRSTAPYSSIALWNGPWGVLACASRLFLYGRLAIQTKPLRKCHDMLALAQERCSSSYSLAHARTVATWLAQMSSGGASSARTCRGGNLPLHCARNSRCGEAWATVLQGWALARQGEAKEGSSQIRTRVLLSTRAIGAELLQSYFLALLAETYGKAGQTRGRA